MKLPTIVEWMVQKYWYVPGAKLTEILILLADVGENMAEQVSPLGHELVNIGPSLSTSSANWCVVSELVSCMSTVSP
jgi:hypothetical protein